MNHRLLAATMLAASTIALGAAPAAAQDRGWSGPYVGGQIGIGMLQKDNARTEFDTNRDGNFGDTVNTAAGANAFSPGFCGGAASSSGPGTGCDRGDRGVEGGIHAGFDAELGGLVVGAVAEYERHDIDDSVSAFSTTPAFYTLTRSLRSSYGVRARAGAAITPSTLLYATGGVVRGSFRQSFSTSNTANAFAITDTRTKGWGYRLGAGAEQKLGGNLSVGALYLYSSIKDDDSAISVTQGTAPATNPFVLVNSGGTVIRRTDRFKSHALKLTGSLRF
nr:outer membrane beta-barrel protein [uncultured Sphingomonas sp.]